MRDVPHDTSLREYISRLDRGLVINQTILLTQGCSAFAHTDAFRFSLCASSFSGSKRLRLLGPIATCHSTLKPVLSDRFWISPIPCIRPHATLAAVEQPPRLGKVVHVRRRSRHTVMSAIAQAGTGAIPGRKVAAPLKPICCGRR